MSATLFRRGVHRDTRGFSFFARTSCRGITHPSTRDRQNRLPKLAAGIEIQILGGRHIESGVGLRRLLTSQYDLPGTRVVERRVNTPEWTRTKAQSSVTAQRAPRCGGPRLQTTKKQTTKARKTPTGEGLRIDLAGRRAQARRFGYSRHRRPKGLSGQPRPSSDPMMPVKVVR